MNDEQQIRQLVATWLQATRDGDTDQILSLMTDDVVFLVAGQPVMRKDDFAAASRAQSRNDSPRIDGTSEIVELQIAGEWAWMWTRLSVAITPPDAAPTIRSGHTLSILRKKNGRWLLARDANMLAPADS